jgi:hypothetical protein
LGNWTHYVFTFDGVTKTAYCNGAIVVQWASTTDVDDIVDDILIGGDANAGFSYPFNGSISSVRIYSRALTAGEVTAIKDNEER